jgi:hypothetical protein
MGYESLKPAERDETGKIIGGHVADAVPSTDSENAALDQLLKSAQEVKGTLSKSPTLLAKYSDPNDILAVVGADGQLSFSGVQKVNEAKIAQVQSRDIDYKDRMSAIRQEVDPEARQSLLSSFQADYTEQFTKDVQKHRAAADQQLGVTSLRQQLLQAEAADQRDPLYDKYKSDSPLTTRIRNAVAIAEERARAATKDLVASDPYIARNHALVSNFIETENKNLARLIQKKDVSDAKIEEETASLTPTNLAAIAASYPGKTIEELKRIAYGLKTNPATKNEYKAVLDPNATPEDYATALVSGMGAVRDFVVKEQSDKLGIPKEQVASEISNLQRLLNNDTELLSMVKKVFPAEEAKKFNEIMANHKLEKGKDAALEWHKTKLSWVMDLQSKIAANNLKSNVQNWKPVNGINFKDIPEVKQIIDRFSVQNKTVGINELIDQFVSTAPRQQQAEKFQILKDAYGANIDILNTGIYGKVKKDSMMKELEARFVGHNFLDDLNVIREKANETKPFRLDPNQKFPEMSNVDISAAKVSSWLKEQAKYGTVNAGPETNIYNRPTPREQYYNEQGPVFRGMGEGLQTNPKLKAAIDSAPPSNNVEDRR